MPLSLFIFVSNEVFFLFTVETLVLCVGSHCWIENLNAEEFFIFFFSFVPSFHTMIFFRFVFKIVERINEIDFNVKLL